MPAAVYRLRRVATDRHCLVLFFQTGRGLRIRFNSTKAAKQAAACLRDANEGHDNEPPITPTHFVNQEFDQ